MSDYYYEGYVSIGIWVKRTAGWQMIQTYDHYVSEGPYATGGSRTFNYGGYDITLALGADVQAVGVTLESGQYSSATLDSFTKLAWQAQGSTGSTRSATPNGEKTTVTVTP